MIAPEALTELERAALNWHVSRVNHGYVTLCGIRTNAGLEPEDRRARQFAQNLTRTILKQPDAREKIQGFVGPYTAYLEARHAVESRAEERPTQRH